MALQHYTTEAAMAEGWVLSERADGFYEIQRYDDDPAQRFTNDAEAATYVRDRAQSGSLMHKEAMLLDGTPCRHNMLRI